MVVTAFLSMVISNTATTAMMVPIAVGLVGEVTDVWAADSADDAAPPADATSLGADPSNFQLAMLLGVAYAASLGGGISLANALVSTGATEWLASVTLGALGPAPLPLVVLAVVTLVVTVGELASNTAMAAILASLLVGIGPAYADALGTSATTAAAFLALVGAVAASYGFALPVATPPNAIAYGAGYMDKDDMLRAGLPLDAVVILLATGVLTLLLRFVWPVVL